MNKFQIGDVTVTRVTEIETPTNPLFLYPDMVPEAFEPHADWLKPHFMGEEGRILMAIQSFVVESEGARIMVDTCVGNDKNRDVPYWNQLQIPFRLSFLSVHPSNQVEAHGESQ